MKHKRYEQPSAALKQLMRENAHYLASQRGNPPHGTCMDCARQVPANELVARCPACAGLVCVDCVDAHTNRHNDSEEAIH